VSASGADRRALAPAAQTGSVRLVTMEPLAPVRSQTIYHAVASELTRDGPDTILLVTPSAPYVSIGFHQDARQELDLDACRRLGLPVVRREVGGGAVYLDGGQVFCQWIFRADRLPAALVDRYALYADPLVRTYRSFGVPAEYRPINDIHVRGRKIGGTGAARIGVAEVMVGSLMFDFDHDAMARVLRVPSEKMRDKVAVALRDYVTTVRREADPVPARADVVESYLGACADVLGRPLEEGGLRPEEVATAEALDERMGSDEWTYRTSSRARPGVKIHEDVHVSEGTHKAPAGLVRVTLVVRSGIVLDVSLTGDFTLLPQGSIVELERGLVGVPADAAGAEAAAADLYQRLGIDAPGLPPSELAAAVAAALGPGPEPASLRD
jgi:lipoate-protein ligase A